MKRPLALLSLILISVSVFDGGGFAVAQDRRADPSLVQLRKENSEGEQDTAPAEEESRTERKIRRERRNALMRHRGREVVEMGHNVRVAKDEVKRNIVVIAGNVKIDGRVDQDVVVIAGNAEINGEIGGSLVTVLGSAKLGPEARVGHDCVVIGGPLAEDENSEIGGQRVFFGFHQVLPNFTPLQEWLSSGLLLGRPLPPRYVWVWTCAGMFLLLYLGLALLFPKPLQASMLALREQPVGSFFTGMLLILLFGPILFLLVVSVAGLLVIPFLICATLLALLFGKAAVYCYAGEQLTRRSKTQGSGLLLVLAVGALVFYLIYTVPILGFMAWGVVTLLGLGAVVLAAFRSFRREGATSFPSAPPVIVTRPAAASSAGAASPGAEPVPPADEMMVLERVGFWRRLVATFLDFVLLSMLLAVSGPAFLLIWVAYYVAMWTWKGTSIGGLVLGIKVVRLNGAPVDFSVALVRSLSSFFSALVLFLGFFWAGWDQEKQAWHDKIAGTLVVRVPKGMSLI
jgi:uncharacterized RDD family membrane protein YckC